MSQPEWKRRLSGAEYIYQTYLLNVRLGEIMANKPQKYKQNYTDEIIKTALSALKHTQTADEIFLSRNSTAKEYEIRAANLIAARGEVSHVATASFIFLEIVRKHDYASEGKEKEFQKLYDQEMEIGEKCEKCHKLISGLISSDREIYKKYIMPK
ncbi:MAG: hypothetical protein ACI4ET_07075 [Bilifractor sp.]